MRLSKPVAVPLLVATLLPLAHFAFFTFVFLSAVVNGPEVGPTIPTRYLVQFILHFLAIVWSWGLLAFYLVFLFKSAAVPSDQKVLWAVVLFFGNVLAMPIFWYLFVWRTPPPGQSDAPPSPPDAPTPGVTATAPQPTRPG